WVSIPLAVVSATGIYLGFPQNARLVMSSIAPMAPQGQRPAFGPVTRDTQLTPDSALAAARALEGDARPAAVFLPTGGGDRGRARGAPTGASPQAGAGSGEGPIWRVQLRTSGSELITVA